MRNSPQPKKRIVWYPFKKEGSAEFEKMLNEQIKNYDATHGDPITPAPAIDAPKFGNAARALVELSYADFAVGRKINEKHL